LVAYPTSLIEPRSAVDWLLSATLNIAQRTALVGLFVIGHYAFFGSRRVNLVIRHRAHGPTPHDTEELLPFHDNHLRFQQKHGAQHDFYHYLGGRA
jgi:hypothetical protein